MRVARVLLLMIVIAFVRSNLAFAQCAIPNQITNGSVADAAQVMENFNALVGCANSNLSPVGKPTPGLALFTGPNSVTSGNLTGDVITSGSLATVLSNSGVIAGVYGDPSHVAQITVDSKGRVTAANSLAINGGIGSGLYSQVLTATPTVAETGLSNIIGSSVTLSDSPVGVYLLGTNAGMGAFTSSVPSTPYSITALLATNQPGAGVLALGWTDGTRVQFVYIGTNPLLYVQSNNNINAFSGINYQSPNSFNNRNMFWFKIRDDGTNLYFMSSQDGFHFTLLYTVVKSSGFLGPNGYSHIFVGSPGGSGTSDVTVMSWAQGAN